MIDKIDTVDTNYLDPQDSYSDISAHNIEVERLSVNRKNINRSRYSCNPKAGTYELSDNDGGIRLSQNDRLIEMEVNEINQIVQGINEQIEQVKEIND